MDQNEDSPVSRFLKGKSQQPEKGKSQQPETGGDSTSSETASMSEQQRRTWRELQIRAGKILVHGEDGHIWQKLSEVKFRLDDLPNVNGTAREIEAELNSIRVKLDEIDDETEKSAQGREIIGFIVFLGILGILIWWLLT